MKRMFAMIFAAAMVIAMLAVFPMIASADEPTVWSGKANIKWYLDGKAAGAQEWHIKTAEDLAGLACLVNASNRSCYSGGVYYDANYDVLGYKRTELDSQKAYADSSLLYKPTAGDGSQLVDGFNFDCQNIYLDADIVLNTGNAADWGDTPPANVWYPIGGTLPDAAQHPTFNGIFQGEGHTISGAYYVSNPTKEVYCVGLFGMVGKGSLSQFRNLTVENCYFGANNSVGSLCGRSRGPITVMNCCIKNCFIVANTETSQQYGGMIGGVYGGGATIANCGLENVTVICPRYLGGFIGLSNGQSVTVKNSYITGTVTAPTVDTVTPADPDNGVEETTTKKYGCEAGIIAGRAVGGSYVVENVFMAVEVNQLGKAEDQDQGAGNLAQAGVIYAGKGTQLNYSSLAIENIYCASNFDNTEAVAGITEGIEGYDPLSSYDFNVITLDALTGATAETTLQGFDFENIWEVSETGIPQLRLAKLLEADIAEREAASQGGEEEQNYNPTPVRPGKTTTEPSTTEDPGTTTEPEKTKKKGCGNVIVGAPVVALIALAGVVLIRRKKED